MSALVGCAGTSTSAAVLLRRRGRGVASLGGHSREDAGTERGVFADGGVRVAALPHPDARIARAATAAMPGRMSTSLRLPARPRLCIAMSLVRIRSLNDGGPQVSSTNHETYSHRPRRWCDRLD